MHPVGVPQHVPRGTFLGVHHLNLSQLVTLDVPRGTSLKKFE